MEPDEWRAFVADLAAKIRPHAGYFSWPPDRELEELGVVDDLAKSLEAEGRSFFNSWRSRGQGNDPPDVEALSQSGETIAIEVTEFVDGRAIEAAKSEHAYFRPPYSTQELFHLLTKRIATKDAPRGIKGGPYSQYVLVIHCDEPRVLDYVLLQAAGEFRFPVTNLIDRAFLLLSYSPFTRRCPHIELKVRDV